MDGRIAVDYMGDGIFTDVIPGSSKITNIMGSIPVTNIPLTVLEEGWIWSMEFTLPYPIINPYLHLIGIKGCDHFFTVVNESAGVWKLTVLGRRLWYYLSNNVNYRQMGYSYSTPNAASANTRILFGGFRG